MDSSFLFCPSDVASVTGFECSRVRCILFHIPQVDLALKARLVEVGWQLHHYLRSTLLPVRPPQLPRMTASIVVMSQRRVQCLRSLLLPPLSPTRPMTTTASLNSNGLSISYGHLCTCFRILYVPCPTTNM